MLIKTDEFNDREVRYNIQAFDIIRSWAADETHRV